MAWEKVIEAWSQLQEAVDTYEEALRFELEEAVRLRDLGKITTLQGRVKHLRRLRSLLQRVEKALSL
ncbi:MAG: hypothetical protein N2253_05915 [Bacteroidia bacterium]|nr:hypothetical protein [Bacteroidia bacterium]MCX7764409.1 hypothetical protein [Bacteroidia bacterium]